MTNRELDNAFKLYLNKVDSQAVPDFIPLERQRILNDALLSVAKELVFKKDDNQDNIDLRTHLSTPWKGTFTNLDNQAVLPLPEDYLSFGRAGIRLKAPFSQYTVATRLVSEAQLSKLLEDPFNAPEIGNPAICFLYGNVVAYPSASCDMLLGSYYRVPRQISLADPQEIVDMTEAKLFAVIQRATTLALESIADQRIQTQSSVAAATTTP